MKRRSFIGSVMVAVGWLFGLKPAESKAALAFPNPQTPRPFLIIKNIACPPLMFTGAFCCVRGAEVPMHIQHALGRVGNDIQGLVCGMRKHYSDIFANEIVIHAYNQNGHLALRFSGQTTDPKAAESAFDEMRAVAARAI